MSRARFSSIGTIRLQAMLAECLKCLSQRRRPPYSVNLLRGELARRGTDRPRHFISAGGPRVIREDTAGRPSVRQRHEPAPVETFETAEAIDRRELQIGRVQGVDDLSHLGALNR